MDWTFDFFLYFEATIILLGIIIAGWNYPLLIETTMDKPFFLKVSPLVDYIEVVGRLT